MLYFKKQMRKEFFIMYTKTCENPNKYDDYSISFEMEFLHMNQLRILMEKNSPKRAYSHLFPYYYSTNQLPSGQPYIRMEQINGTTLEDILSSRPIHTLPHRLLTHKQILHIFEQLHDAIYWLYQGGMMQIDLSPQNIIVLNSDFDIHLIDFTNCYYTNYPSRSYKIIDNRIDTHMPIGMQLRDACALLFTRLFFSGKTHYNQYFSMSDTTITTPAQTFFEKEYHQLLNCLFYPNSVTYVSDMDDLSYWEDWYKHLVSVLKNY